MLATLLKHAGIDFMMIGCNSACAPLKVPLLYWWQGLDQAATLLRLWENAGQSGNVTIRLPEGTTFKQAQPVDLRGCPVGKPIAVRNGAFKARVDAFAPVSFVFEPET